MVEDVCIISAEFSKNKIIKNRIPKGGNDEQ